MFGVEKYPAKIAELLALPVGNALDAGSPEASVRPRLADLRASDLAVGVRPNDLAMAQACLSGLWLRFDFLDESHQLSQEIETPTGSYWHAIMHRREGDYGNSKYWLRRAGHHPAMTALHEAAQLEWPSGEPKHGRQPAEIRKLLDETVWDPNQFVDLCAAACGGRTDLAAACRTLQRLEWETLFDFCFTAAVGET